MVSCPRACRSLWCNDGGGCSFEISQQRSKSRCKAEGSWRRSRNSQCIWMTDCIWLFADISSTTRQRIYVLGSCRVLRTILRSRLPLRRSTEACLAKAQETDHTSILPPTLISGDAYPSNERRWTAIDPVITIHSAVCQCSGKGRPRSICHHPAHSAILDRQSTHRWTGCPSNTLLATAEQPGRTHGRLFG